MGGTGYCDQDEWQSMFNNVFTAARFANMNKRIARKINTKVTGNPTTDVASQFTYTAQYISDEMMATFSVFLKEYSMQDPPEFIHYKLPHFTPDHLTDISIMKKTVRVGKVVY